MEVQHWISASVQLSNIALIRHRAVQVASSELLVSRLYLCYAGGREDCTDDQHLWPESAGLQENAGTHARSLYELLHVWGEIWHTLHSMLGWCTYSICACVNKFQQIQDLSVLCFSWTVHYLLRGCTLQNKERVLSQSPSSQPSSYSANSGLLTQMFMSHHEYVRMLWFVICHQRIVLLSVTPVLSHWNYCWMPLQDWLAWRLGARNPFDNSVCFLNKHHCFDQFAQLTSCCRLRRMQVWNLERLFFKGG